MIEVTKDGNSVVEDIHRNAGLLFGYLERILGSGSVSMTHQKEVFQYFWYPVLAGGPDDWHGSYEGHVPCFRLSRADPKVILDMAMNLAERMKNDVQRIQWKVKSENPSPQNSENCCAECGVLMPMSPNVEFCQACDEDI